MFLFFSCPDNCRKLAARKNATNIGRSKGCKERKKEEEGRGKRKERKGKGRKGIKGGEGKDTIIFISGSTCL